MTSWFLLPAFLLAAITAYVGFCAVSVDLPRRLRFALGRIAIDRVADRAARRYGDRPLFTTDEPCAWSVPGDPSPDPCAWSANRVRLVADRVAAALVVRLSIPRGGRVAILKQNHLDIHVLHTAIVRAGGIACPMNGDFAATKIAPYLLNIDASVLITDVTTLQRVLDDGGSVGGVTAVVIAGSRQSVDRDTVKRLATGLAQHNGSASLYWIEELLAADGGDFVPVRRGGREPLYLVHSSGTTGFPKAVILEHRRQAHAMRGWMSYVHVSRRRDKGYFAVPNNHQAVILTFNCLLLLGLRVHWAREAGRNVDARRLVQDLASGRYTGFYAFPIVYTALREVDLAAHDLSAMRFWASTADAAHEAMIRPCVAVGGTFRKLGLPITGSVYLDAQGSSEVGTPSVIRYYTRFTSRYGRRIGRRHSTPFGPRIRITRNGVPVTGRGIVGRLEVRGRTVFPGYWNNHNLTSEAIVDGWFFTGDIAMQSRDGHFVQLDREVDVIRTAAGDVYSLPIEEKLHRHPGVFDLCVYGARQLDGTQLPAAAIALRDGGADADEGRLLAELNERLSAAEQLSFVEIYRWEEFPIGITGKTLKRVFRERTEPRRTTEANRPIAATLAAQV